MTNGETHDDTHPLRASARTLDVLEYVGQQGYPVSAAQIGEACRIPRSSLYKLLRVLEERGYLAGLPDEAGWTPGQRLLDLRADSLLFVHGMLVLEALERGGGRMSPEDLAAATELPPELVGRLLVALADHALVMAGYDGTYGLGLRFVSMASRVGWAERLQLTARPVLVAPARRERRDREPHRRGRRAGALPRPGGEPLRAALPRLGRPARPAGGHVASGAAFTESGGCSAHVVKDAVEHGVTAVSAAVTGMVPKAGVNVIGPTWRLEERGLDAIAELVCAAAAELTAAYEATLHPAL